MSIIDQITLTGYLVNEVFRKSCDEKRRARIFFLILLFADYKQSAAERSRAQQSAAEFSADRQSQKQRQSFFPKRN